MLDEKRRPRRNSGASYLLRRYGGLGAIDDAATGAALLNDLIMTDRAPDGTPD